MSERHAVAELDPINPRRVLLQGKVESDKPHEPVASIIIEQEGEAIISSDRKEWNHSWSETKRHVKVAPFRLALPSGQSVHVEPDADVQLSNDYTRTESDGDRRRSIIIEIKDGEEIFAAGTLEKGDEAAGGEGYRGQRRRVFALRGSPSKPLVLSKEPPAKRHLYWARFEGAIFAFALLIIVWGQAIMFRDFNRLMLFGRVVQTEIVSIKDIGAHLGTTEYNVVLGYTLAPEGERREIIQRVSADQVAGLSQGGSIPVRVLPSDPRLYAIGGLPELDSLGGPVLIIFVLMVSAALILEKRERSLLWYERKRVDETGHGPLRP